MPPPQEEAVASQNRDERDNVILAGIGILAVLGGLKIALDYTNRQTKRAVLQQKYYDSAYNNPSNSISPPNTIQSPEGGTWTYHPPGSKI